VKRWASRGNSRSCIDSARRVGIRLLSIQVVPFRLDHESHPTVTRQLDIRMDSNDRCSHCHCEHLVLLAEAANRGLTDESSMLPYKSEV
jgi:hypothetical protein